MFFRMINIYLNSHNTLSFFWVKVNIAENEKTIIRNL